MYSLITEPDRTPSPTFSFNDPQAYYIIRKDRFDNYWISYDNLQRDDQIIKFPTLIGEVSLEKYNNLYTMNVDTSIDRSKKPDRLGTTISMFIGNSKVELEPFLGKPLKIKGSFRKTYSDTQCIVEKCHKFSTRQPYTKAAVVDIESISSK